MNHDRRGILHVIDQAGPGGAETIFLELVTRLDPRRWSSHAVIPGSGWLEDALVERGVRPIVIPAKGGYNVGLLFRLAKTIRRLDVDLVQAHLFGATLYGGMAGRLAGIPVVATIHGKPDLPAPGQKGSLRYLILRTCADRIVLVSRSLREAFHDAGSFPSGRSSVIHNGIDLDRFDRNDRAADRRALELEPDHVVVGTVGNLRPAKGLDVFLRMAAHLAPQDPRFRFVIAGDLEGGLFPDLRRLRDALGLQKRLRFLGFRSDVERVFGALDIFVCSSHSEGFSLTTVQAMASGVPVVATRSGGPEEIITDGVDGLLVPPGDPEGLAAAVLQLSRDEGLGRKLVRQARAVSEQGFSIDRMLGEYERLYGEALG